MSRAWRCLTDLGFLLAVAAVGVAVADQFYVLWITPVAKIKISRPGGVLGVLGLFSLAVYTVYAVVAGYYQADEDKGKIVATVWIFLGVIPFVAGLVSPWGFEPGVVTLAAFFTLLAIAYRFQRRGWLL
jgi:hypothetical protein